LAYTALERGDHKRAVRLLEEALASFREQGDVAGAFGLLFTMGYSELALGNLARATTLLEESLALSRDFGEREVVAGCLMSLGIAAQRRGDPERAKTLLKESLAMDVEMRVNAHIAENLEGLAQAAGTLDEDVRAARLWGAAGTLREATGRPWWSAERLLHEPQLVAARSRMDEPSWDTAFAEGKAMGLEEAVEYALSEEPATSSATPQAERTLDSASPVALTPREGEVAAMVARG
jgi:tetratricopeptide (TPR) repeat protein